MRAWVFGDDISTDAIAPGRYMKSDIAEMAKHCLETVDPEFAKSVRFGDVLVAGRNFGVGSSREQAPAALKHLGIAALVAESFAGLFFRNSLNLGLPALGYGLSDQLPAGRDHTELVGLMGKDKKAVDGLTFALDGPDGVEVVPGVDPLTAAVVLERLGAAG